MVSLPLGGCCSRAKAYGNYRRRKSRLFSTTTICIWFVGGARPPLISLFTIYVQLLLLIAALCPHSLKHLIHGCPNPLPLSLFASLKYCFFSPSLLHLHLQLLFLTQKPFFLFLFGCIELGSPEWGDLRLGVCTFVLQFCFWLFCVRIFYLQTFFRFFVFASFLESPV